MALAQTIIADIVSPRERGRYQGYIGAVFATSSVGGPVLGGFLTEHIDWSLIFWINLPLGLVALGMTSSVLRRVPFHPRKHRLDVIGALLMMAAAIALLLALSWGGRAYEWISAQIGALLLTSAVLWGLFAWRLVSTKEPFLPLDRSGQSGGALRDARRRLQHGHAGRHDDFCAAVFRGGAASLRQPIRHGADPADGGHGGDVHHHRAADDACGALQAHVAGGARDLDRVAGAAGDLAGLDADRAGAAAADDHRLRARHRVSVSTVCMQNAVSRAQMGVATGAANFFRALFSALVVAVLGAIVLGGLGGVAGMSVEMLARTATAPELAYAFRFVFLACALVLSFGMAFLISMEERPLKGPTAPSQAATAPTAPATPIPAE